MTQGALYSDQWYRVKDLQPRLRRQLAVHRHYYRGAPWYVIEASSSQQRIRLNDAAYYLFSQLDGTRTVGDLWQQALAALDDDAPSQQDVIALLAELADAGMADFAQQSDIDTLFDQQRRKQDKETQSRYWNPLFMRFAIFDPDRLAARWAPRLGFCFGRTALVLWIALMVVTVLAGWYAWPGLTAALQADALSPRHLVILWFVFPIMKLLHEFAHALAVRHWGGEVHEFGVALLILMPVPYVDASASGGFANKYRRMAVAGAGIVVETTLGACGLLLWLLVEPGLVRDIALNLALTGFASSLLFNGNPLLKFDAYYVLSDGIEIPNLASRANKYLLYLLQRYAFGSQARSPVTAPGERRWFVAYGLAALAYKLSLTIGICLFVASQYFFLGVLLALWSLAMQLLWPVIKGVRFLLTAPALTRTRARALTVAGGAATASALAFFLLPLPHATQVRGVVWPVDDAIVRSETDCFVQALLVPSQGHEVEAQTPLLRCDDTLINAELADLRAQATAARAAVRGTRDRSAKGMRRSELKVKEALLARAERRSQRRTIVSQTRGELYLPDAANLEGNYFRQGDLVGYLLSPDNLSVRVMLSQERASLLDQSSAQIALRRLSAPEQVYATQLLRQLPTATEQLVTPALGQPGGGDLAVRPQDDQGTVLAEPAFALELALPEALASSRVGEALAVRIDHGTAPAAVLLYRQLQLLLLRQFGV